MASQRVVTVSISHSALPIHAEKRFPSSITIEGLKDKLHLVVGTAPEFQKLQLQDGDGKVLCTLEPDASPLGAFVQSDHAFIHVVDMDPQQSVAQLSDVSQVKKFEISEEAYSKREDTYRKFKHRFLKEHVENEEKKQASKLKIEETEIELSKKLKVDQRCQLNGGTANAKRGKISFVGAVDFKPGVWVGVQLDEPTGKNDGSVKGKRYFTCEHKYGLFTRPSKVEVGDFPEKDPFDELSDSDMEEI